MPKNPSCRSGGPHKAAQGTAQGPTFWGKVAGRDFGGVGVGVGVGGCWWVCGQVPDPNHAIRTGSNSF